MNRPEWDLMTPSKFGKGMLPSEYGVHQGIFDYSNCSRVDRCRKGSAQVSYA